MNKRDFEPPLSRRQAIAATGVVLGGLAVGGRAMGQGSDAFRAPPPLEHVLDLSLQVEPALVVGSTPAGARRIVNVTGGTFEGPGLRGNVLPGGADWLVGRADGVSQLDVRITLRTDDEQLIAMQYRGLIDGNPVEVPTPAGRSAVEGTYWRVTPIFETGAEQYAWLNRIVTVGVGQSAGGRVNYTVYAVR
jgi:Protein of unknown function (DUF3237)